MAFLERLNSRDKKEISPWAWQAMVFARRLRLSEELSGVRFSIGILLFWLVVFGEIIISNNSA